MRNWLEYIPFLITANLVRALPRKAALALGAALGALARHLQPRRVRIATDNLRHALPDLTTEEIQATIDKMFVFLGQGFMEMLRLDMYRGEQDLSHYFQINGRENVDAALELGRGCIILTGHVGFWEAGNILIPKLGLPFGVVAKPMRNPHVDAYFSRLRTAAGSYIINSRKGARGILKALQDNHCVGILLDQHIKGPGSVKAPFFSQPAHTTTIITQMATRYQIPIVPAFAYREPDQTYRCDIGEMFLLQGDLSEQNIFDNTTLLNKIIEDGVRRNISQWFWLHRRWRPCCEK